ncbi:hypothetical protein DFA_00336 [Cavenderia fasciculata]|uniref:RGS domain-containing protein n=1 Tax=Cavenderia fasciculata TaxID=261658 RepID=F4PR64_CACFS|nr:uncharacterized protein DFA_00336 [Cavenderia fasciculata]EGG20475.1 hypothetical protein DFA_00336 [Cavenderia fasciculata]|eukprot:XP_004358325.1 hypothetical protein DFA_00336 [Cavenderia fasciculata]
MMVGLNEIVHNKTLALSFRKFLHERYNNENLSFWLEAENFKAIDNDNTRLKRSKEIYQKYFSTDSKYELNIDHHQKKELETKMQGTPSIDLFVPVQITIRKLMEMDAIPLFLKSDLYKQCKENQSPSDQIGNSSSSNSSSGGGSSERDRSVTICEMEEFLLSHPPIKK